ncbi:serine/arginine-rich splicing factor SR45-like [Panicum virgatum]|uniref:serine/arginine-rich splicing factor SR45-like n=1 Tax=Panicum virgatum TaxID=38727 RepID=UPI0019D53DB9|nr:serine/arginine-rich splicing factor SR45-like [Panicum virgatum]
MDPATGVSPAAHGHGLNAGELETGADPPTHPRRALLARPPQPCSFVCHPSDLTGERGERGPPAKLEAAGEGPCQTERDGEAKSSEAGPPPPRPHTARVGRVPTATASRRGARAPAHCRRGRAPPTAAASKRRARPPAAVKSTRAGYLALGAGRSSLPSSSSPVPRPRHQARAEEGVAGRRAKEGGDSASASPRLGKRAPPPPRSGKELGRSRGKSGCT